MKTMANSTYGKTAQDVSQQNVWDAFGYALSYSKLTKRGGVPLQRLNPRLLVVTPRASR
ncbi:hypothetical protein [Rhodococcus sp. MH15]|uniref:hypothetical protein n=1 Tax=Rhodococcus sp. MH15 TaxID=1761014 RepID=UPI001C4EF4EB|nr:hypothetical protein [Rhodococcus sp. MH15]